MNDYQKYINALRKCAKEHENDRTFTGHIIVSDLCRDTANLLEELEQEPRKAIWIERFDIPRGCGEYLCSNCMDEYGTDLLYAYCPNCGAYHGKNKETIKEEDFDNGRNQNMFTDWRDKAESEDEE